MPIAKVERYHGEPAIMIDHVPYPPMTVTVRNRGKMTEEQAKAYYRDLGEAGLKIFYLTTNTRWHSPGDPEKGIRDGITGTVEELEFLMDAVPDAYVMLRLNVSPNAEWVNSHPEEQVLFSDGKPRKVICTSVGDEILSGMHSLCSEAWMRDADIALKEYIDEIRRTPYFDRVIGFFLCAAGTSEWYYPQELQNADGTYGDFSEPFRKRFESYLRGKYGSVETLRRVWGRDDATFENPIIPNVEEREFVSNADQEIIKGLHDWEKMGREIGLEINMDARQKASLGVFLNSNGFEHVADFYSAWNDATARTIVHFAQTLKRLCSDRLVGAFYGSYGCQNYFDGSTASGTLTILDSGVVDFLAAPGVYNNREPGGVVAQREMQDSFRLRNMIYICEDDSRTHYAEPWVQRDAMALYTVEDSENTLKRDFARDICEDIHGWWFDMGPGWYRDRQILDLFRRQREIADYAYSLDRTKKNEIAVIYDTEALHHVSQSTSNLVLDLYRTSDLHRIGAPIDYYFHNDLSRPDMPDYKFYIMLNQYYLTDAERSAIKEKACRNHAVVLWLYAPGFIDPDASPVMDVKNISDTVGMKISLIDKTFFPHFRVDPASHPVLRGTSASRRYGIIDRDVHSNIWLSPSVLPPVYANPGFAIDDPDAVVLGRYCCDNRAAMAMTDKEGFTSIYCAAHVLRSDMLASIAEYAGCHLYLRQDDVLYANENFVTVHASSDGTRRVWFKKECSPYEVYEKRFYGQNVSYIDVDMKLGETKMWCLNGSF